MEKLRVVSIGGFGHAGSVFEEMEGMAEAELVAFAPAYEGEDLSAVAKRPLFRAGPSHVDDYREMLKRFRPDVAVVSTRLDRISQAATEAAQAGCHLICEKPLALDHDSLRTLYEAVRGAGARLIAMLSMRREPAFAAARECCGRGAIGEALIANARKSYQWGKRPEWFGRRETYGGTIGWIGIHALDMIHYVTGQEFVSAAAMQSNQAHQERPACEDNCALILELANGGHATVSLDYCRPAGAPTHGDDWLRVVGSRGVIEANGSRQTCVLLAEGQGLQTIALGPPPAMYRSFLLSLLGRADFDLQRPGDPFLLTHACLCARDAADTATVVKIPRGLWT